MVSLPIRTRTLSAPAFVLVLLAFLVDEVLADAVFVACAAGWAT
jgi:hypothetical protein